MCIVCLLSLIVAVFAEYTKFHKTKVSGILMFIVVVVLMSNQTNLADISNYRIRYAQYQSGWSFGDAQWAMSLYSYVCNLLHLDFFWYRASLILLGMLLIYLALKRLQISSFPFAICYIVFPMIIDAVQLKNFIAMAFIFLAFTFLTEEGAIALIKSLALLFLAAGFHIVAYFYFPFVLFYYIANTEKKRRYATGIIILFSLILSNQSLSNIVLGNILSNFDDSIVQRTSKFFLSRVNLGWIVYVISVLVMFTIMRYICTRYEQKKNDVDNKKYDFIKLAYLCAIFSFSFVPFFFLRQDFSRLIRNFIPIYHSAFILALSDSYSDENGVQKVISGDTRTLLIIGYSVFLFYSFYWDISIYRDSVLLPFLHLK